MYDTIDSTPLGDISWESFSLQYNGEIPADNVPSWMEADYDVWFRDPPHRNGVVLLAFLAIPKTTHEFRDDAAFRKFRRQLLHSSLAKILEPLKPGMTSPEVIRFPDDHFRKVIYGLALTSQTIQNRHCSPASCKAGVQNWIDGKWFRHTFVTTYMAFVGQTINPWDVPVKKAIKVMQQIWDATNSHEYEITSSTAVYQKTIQRLADSWRNVIGSTAIAILLAFLTRKSTYKIQMKNAKNSASITSTDFAFCMRTLIMPKMQSKWRGLFRNPFVLQTFAAHLTAIEGCKAIPGLHDDAKLADAATGALGLSAAAVERALTLVVTGTLTTATARAAKGKMRCILGLCFRAFAKSARGLNDDKFSHLMNDAQAFVKPTRARNRSTNVATETTSRMMTNGHALSTTPAAPILTLNQTNLCHGMTCSSP
ncbi:hypothetical protein JB92DRAFT_2837755 [Gautieria morchelliformis]|nr:hypothetical protein JB92DRAFT_2837755 [Gautieria morchelliformis]